MENEKPVSESSPEEQVQSQAQAGAQAQPPSAAAPEPSSTIAMVSMILGIISIPMACVMGIGIGLGIAAVVLGIIALVQLRKGKAKGKGMAVAGICTGVCGSFFMVLLTIAMLLPALNSAREKARQLSCASNMKQIGLAMKDYANDNGGFFPSGEGVEGLEMLRKGGYLTDLKRFSCPSSLNVEPQAPLSDERVSYIYRGAGLKSEAANDVRPLLIEKPCHEKYSNVLFGDGRVQGFADENWQERAAREGK